MAKPRTYRKPANRSIRAAKIASASEAIGVIKKNSDCFILTFGQFSLIDALVVILDQVGPADVAISTWTAADAHLERSRELLESASIRSLRWILDRSFEARQPEYCFHMRQLFGSGCIRAIRNHSKFMLIRNEKWDIVVRTSMNMNENPRLENIEIAEDRGFSEFLQDVVDDLFAEVKEGENMSTLPGLESIPEAAKLKEVRGNVIGRERLKEAKTTHVIRR